jgi:hypothetical protein
MSDSNNNDSKYDKYPEGHPGYRKGTIARLRGAPDVCHNTDPMYVSAFHQGWADEDQRSREGREKPLYVSNPVGPPEGLKDA